MLSKAQCVAWWEVRGLFLGRNVHVYVGPDTILGTQRASPSTMIGSD